MQKIFVAMLIAMACACGSPICAQFHHQPDESDLSGIRGINNVRNARYPRLLPDNRMAFKVKHGQSGAKASTTSLLSSSNDFLDVPKPYQEY